MRFCFLFLFIFLASCLDDTFSLFGSKSKPFSAEALGGYQDEKGLPYVGAIPKGAVAKARVTYESIGGVSKEGLLFYYVLLKGDEVFDPPFRNFDEFRVMAKSFYFPKGQNEYDIELINEDPLRRNPKTHLKKQNDHIGTVYSLYIIPDEPSYARNYDFDHPLPDLVAPKDTGVLDMPKWLLKTGKWLNKKDSNLFVSFSRKGGIDELEVNENTGVVGVKRFSYLDEGMAPNYAFSPMDSLSGGGAVSSYGVLEDNSGVYATFQIVHSEHLAFGSSVTFILSKGSNELEVVGYNAILRKEERGFMKNADPKFDWTKVFPTRYRTTGDYRPSFR